MKFFDEIDDDLMKIKKYRTRYNLVKKLYVKYIYPMILKIKITNRIKLHHERMEKDIILYGKMIDPCMSDILREYADIVHKYRLRRLCDTVHVAFLDHERFNVKIISNDFTVIYYVNDPRSKSVEMKIVSPSHYINTSTFSGFLDAIKRKAEFITIESLYRDLEYRINEYIDVLC